MRSQALPTTFIALLIIAVVGLTVFAIFVISGHGKAGGESFLNIGKNQSGERQKDINLSMAKNDCDLKCSLSKQAVLGDTTINCGSEVDKGNFCNEVYVVETPNLHCDQILSMSGTSCKVRVRDEGADQVVEKTVTCSGSDEQCT